MASKVFFFFYKILIKTYSTIGEQFSNQEIPWKYNYSNDKSESIPPKHAPPSPETK